MRPKPSVQKLPRERAVHGIRRAARTTLDQIGVPRASFYRWYDQYQTGGTGALEATEMSPRKLAVRFTDSQGYFVSEATVCRLLKAQNVIDTPEPALTASGCDQAHVRHKPRLLSENPVPSFAEWLDDRRMKHVREE